MHRSSIDDWIRFYDEVIAAGGDWAPEAWFDAVGEAMARALPADSAILDTYRRRVEELLALERGAGGAPESERRISALEAEIQRLIGAADEVIRTPRSVPATTPERHEVIRATPPPPRARQSALRAVAQTALALVLIGAGVLGALYLYDSRLALRVDREVGRYVNGLRSTVEELETRLSGQIRANREEQERLGALHAALEQDIGAFGERVSESLATMMTLREQATAELERRLDDKAGAVAQLLDRVQRRAEALGQTVETVDAQILDLEQSVPGVGARLTRLAHEADQSDAAFGEVMDRLAALKNLAPEIERVAAARRASLEAAADQSQGQLEGVQARIADLDSQQAAGREDLLALRQAVGTERARLEEDRQSLEQAALEAREARQAVNALHDETEAALAAAREAVRARSDQVLGALAEKADLAVLRGDDVLKRAEKRLIRNLDAAGDEAITAFAELRGRELAALAAHVAETRAELDQAKDGLIQGWQRIDAEALERHREVLADLDAYAAEVEAKVADLLDALNVMVAERAERR